DCPQEVLSAIEPLRLLDRQHTHIDELADVVDPVDVLCDPEQRVQISQPALTLFDVRLELVSAVADPLMPRVALGELARDKLCCAAARNFRIKAPLQIIEESLLAP